MIFENYIGIDWSGDKNNFQKGISVSLCKNGTGVPKIIKPKEKYWSRSTLVNWLNKIIVKEKSLVGFDFAFSYPFYDLYSYFPGGHSIIAAVTVEGPSTFKLIFLTPSKSILTFIPFTFKIISVRSSLTPGIDENS